MSWSRGLKISIISLLVLLVLILIALLTYHFNYRDICVPGERFNQCKAELNETNLALKNKIDKVMELESQKETIIKSSSQCEQNLEDCKKRLDDLNNSYNKLLTKFNDLNNSYNQLILNLTECNSALKNKLNENNTQFTTLFEQDITKSYITISFMFFIFLLLPLKIEFGLDSEEKKTKRGITVFVVVFSVGIFLLEYLNLFEYWTNFWIIFVTSSLLGLLTYFLHK